MKRALVAGALATLLLVACGESTVTPEATQPPAVPTGDEPAVYVVERADTLARIAANTGVPLATLVELNDIADPDRIEVGDVLVLEAAPAPVPDPERSIVSREPVDRSLGAQLNDWWDGLYRPDISLSDRSLSQGAVAGLMLPAAVLTFVAVWIGWQLIRRAGLALTAVGGRAFAAAGPRLTTGGSSSTDSMEPRADRSSMTERSRRSLRSSAIDRISIPRLRLPRLRMPRSIAAPPRVSIDRRSLDLSGVGRRLRLAQAAVTRGARRLLRTPRVITRGIEARQERNRRRAALAQAEAYWLTGTERLRIGLLDDAYASFNSSLKIAREHGWDDQVDRNLAALDDIAARRQTPTEDPSSDLAP